MQDVWMANHTKPSGHIALLARLIDSTLETIDNRILERDLQHARRWLIVQHDQLTSAEAQWLACVVETFTTRQERKADETLRQSAARKLGVMARSSR